MQLAFAVAGAALGAAFGPPGVMLGMSAAGWGWMAGAMIGQLWVTAHQPTQNTQGPRITDMRVSAGGYGVGIAKTYGSPRVNGNVIYSSDLIETAHTQTAGNKKTGKQSYTTYTYSVDCAVGVCEGPIVGFRRIWANGKLIYDTSGSGPITDDAIIPLSGMTFYLGTEEQTADPVMQGRLGATNVPGYRGIAYVVFENLQLQEFGNRHPKFDFEIGTGQRLYAGVSNSTELPMYSTDLVNWEERGNNWDNYPDVKSTYVVTNGFNQFSFISQTYSGYDNYFFRTTAIGTSYVNGPINPEYYHLDDFYQVQKYCAYNDGTYIIGARSPANDEIGIWVSNDGVNWTYAGSPFLSEPDYVTNILHIIYSEIFEGFVLVADVDHYTEPWPQPPSNEWQEFYFAPNNDPTNFTKMSGEIPYDTLNGWWMNKMCEFDGKIWYTYEKPIDDHGLYFYVTCTEDGTGWTDTYQLPWDGATYWPYFICYLLSDGQKLVLLYGGIWNLTTEDYELRVRTSTDGTNWSSYTTILTENFINCDIPFYDGRRFVWSFAEPAKVGYSDNGINWTFTDVSSASELGILRIRSISDGDFVQGSETLADVVTDLCVQSGLEMADINTGAIESIEVQGYVRTSRMTARSAIEPLLSAYDVDAYESDGQIKFLPKTSGYSGPVIPEIDLGATPNSSTDDVDTVKVVRLQELELANEITVRYIDRTLDYDANQQYARRLASNSQGSLSFDAPLVLTASAALNLANTMLYRNWVQRDQFSFSTTQKYAAYEPTDLFGIPFGGKNHTVRIVKKEENGYLINWTGVSEDLSVYDQNFVGSSGNYENIPIIPSYCDTDLLVFETPVLRDEYDVLGFVAIAGGQTAATWPGGNLYIVAENSVSTLVSLGELPSRAVTGTLTSNLDPVTDPITSDWDLVNTIDVAIPWGELTSHTEAEVLSGMNTCVVTHGDGSVEVLGFVTATLNSPGNYTLSKLLRRIRQNSSFSDGGYSGQRFALLTSDTVKIVTMQLSSLDNSFTFAGPRVGTSLDSALPVNATLTGMSKKPLSPILVTASRLPNDSVTLNWTRRTRIGGSWPTGEGSPLGELFEAYEIDVMDTDHTTVLRTLTSSVPTVQYSLEDQIADFGSPMPISFEVNVYQISDYVGRGYPANMTFNLIDGESVDQANTSTTGAVSSTHILAGQSCQQSNTCTTGAVS